MAGRYENTQAPLEYVDINNDHLADFKAAPDHLEEVVIARLTEDDIFALSQESLRFKSWTTFRIFLVMFVMGCNQAGYGLDWVSLAQRFLSPRISQLCFNP